MKQTLRFTLKSTSPYKHFEISRGYHLVGSVAFYGHWEKYVFVPLPLTLYSAEDMQQIIDFIDRLDTE